MESLFNKDQLVSVQTAALMLCCFNDVQSPWVIPLYTSTGAQHSPHHRSNTLATMARSFAISRDESNQLKEPDWLPGRCLAQTACKRSCVGVHSVLVDLPSSCWPHCACHSQCNFDHCYWEHTTGSEARDDEDLVSDYSLADCCKGGLCSVCWLFFACTLLQETSVSASRDLLCWHCNYLLI